MTLVEFLAARIADDETAAWVAYSNREDVEDDGEWRVEEQQPRSAEITGIGIRIPDDGGHSLAQAHHIARHDPARVLRDCTAKRLVVERAEGPVATDWRPDDPPTDTPELRFLAAVYSDHPEYREEWRP
jgi:hypothetical protein